MKQKIMYMEQKGTNSGEARIGRMTLIKASSTITYNGKKYHCHKDRGANANYYEEGSGTWYWFSHCQKDGMDSLEPVTVSIDDDVQKEYWEQIRKTPDLAGQSKYQSPGKGRAV